MLLSLVQTSLLLQGSSRSALRYSCLAHRGVQLVFLNNNRLLLLLLHLSLITVVPLSGSLQCSLREHKSVGSSGPMMGQPSPGTSFFFLSIFLSVTLRCLSLCYDRLPLFLHLLEGAAVSLPPPPPLPAYLIHLLLLLLIPSTAYSCLSHPRPLWVVLG